MLFVGCGGGSKGGSTTSKFSSSPTSSSAPISSVQSSSLPNSSVSSEINSSSSSSSEYSDDELLAIRDEVFEYFQHIRKVTEGSQGEEDVFFVDFSVNRTDWTINPIVYNWLNDNVGGFNDCYIKSTSHMPLGALNGVTLYYQHPTSKSSRLSFFLGETESGQLRLAFDRVLKRITSLYYTDSSAVAISSGMTNSESIESIDADAFEANRCDKIPFNRSMADQLGLDLAAWFDTSRVVNGSEYISGVYFSPDGTIFPVKYMADEWSVLNLPETKDCWVIGEQYNSALENSIYFIDYNDDKPFFMIGDNKYYPSYGYTGVSGFRINGHSEPIQRQISGENFELNANRSHTGTSLSIEMEDFRLCE